MIEEDITVTGKDVASHVWYRLHQQRAAALLILHRASESLSSAQKALDIEPDGIHALLTASYAAVEIGKLDTGGDFLERAMRVDPGNAEVWAWAVQVDTMRGKEPAPPPAAVGASDRYQFALAQIAMNGGEWGRVVSIVRPLIAHGKRDPSLLLLLAAALAALGQQEESDTHRAEAEKLASDALEEIAEDHPSPSEFSSFAPSCGARLVTPRAAMPTCSVPRT